TIWLFEARSNLFQGKSQRNLGKFSVEQSVRGERIDEIAFFIDVADFVRTICASGAFEEMRELFRDAATRGAPVLQFFLNLFALHQERIFSGFEGILLYNPVNVSVGETIEAVVDLAEA